MIEFRYKGYIGQLTALEDDGHLHGEVIGLNDVITFASKSPKELEKEFQKSGAGWYSAKVTRTTIEARHD